MFRQTFLIAIAVCAMAITGCTTPRIKLQENLSQHKPIQLVIREHEGPIGSTYVPPNVAGTTAFLYGLMSTVTLVAIVVEVEVSKVRAKEAEERIVPIRDRIHPDDLNRIVNQSFVDVASMQAGFGEVSVVGNGTYGPDDEKLVAQDGFTVIVTPMISMSPYFTVISVAMDTAVYSGDSGKRVYYGGTDCQVYLDRHSVPGQAILTWLSGDTPLLETEIRRCAAANVRVIAAELLQKPSLMGLIPPRKRERVLNPNAYVQVGEIGEFRIFEDSDYGHYLVDVITPVEHPPAVEIVDKEVIVLSEAELIRRINSDDIAKVRETAELLVSQLQYAPEVLDAVAARAWAGAASTGIAETHAVAELCNVLGESGNPRYYEILDRIADRAKDRRIQRYAKQARWNVGEDDVEPFEI